MEDSKPKILVVTGGGMVNVGTIGHVDHGRATLIEAVLAHSGFNVVLDDSSDIKIQGNNFDSIFIDELIHGQDLASLLMSYQGHPGEVEKKSSIGKTLNRGKGKHKNCWDSPYGK